MSSSPLMLPTTRLATPIKDPPACDQMNLMFGYLVAMAGRQWRHATCDQESSRSGRIEHSQNGQPITCWNRRDEDVAVCRRGIWWTPDVSRVRQENRRDRLGNCHPRWSGAVGFANDVYAPGQTIHCFQCRRFTKSSSDRRVRITGSKLKELRDGGRTRPLSLIPDYAI